MGSIRVERVSTGVNQIESAMPSGVLAGRDGHRVVYLKGDLPVRMQE